MADNEKPITFSQLPSAAQAFVKKHFAANKVSMVKMEKELLSTTYDIIFADGTKVEFDKKGNWKDVDCKHKAVPAQLVPVAIQKYVSAHFPGQEIVQIDRAERGVYDIELANGISIDFDKKGNFLRMDD